MGIFEFLKRKKPDRAVIPFPIPNKRISKDELTSWSSLVNLANAVLDTVDPLIPFEFLDVIEKLCIANPDFSQALSNLIRLGNTGHEISVTANDENTINEATKRLNKLAAKINTDQLVNRMIRQIGVTGALSIEWVPKPDLSGIDKVVLVPVKSIRFKYDREEDRYKPYQKLSLTNELIELNETTYTYSALDVSDKSPYAIPPFLAALGNVIIQMFMMDNLKFVIKKIGLMGFVSACLQAPPMQSGESQQAYTERLTTYLNEFAKNFAENYRDGIVAHLDNMTIQHNNVTGDARGAKEILQMNEEQTISGLKTDPALLGRSYSTTETYAGVVYAILVKMLENIQRLVKRTIEKGYQLDLLLGGIIVDDVSQHFNPSAALKPKEEAESDDIRTNTVINKMDAGIISPDDAARELGYNQAYSSEFAVDTGKLTAHLSFVDGCYDIKRISAPIILVKRKKPERDPEGSIERRRLRWVNKYNGDVLLINGKAINGTVNDVKNYLAGLLGLDPDAFAKSVYELVASLHPAGLKKYNLEKQVIADVLMIYRYYRVRDSLVSGKRIPIKYTMADKRAISFLESLDDFHVSKFVTNKSVRSRMLGFLKNEHLEGRTAKVDSFMKTFKTELGDLSKSEVRRIVDTSVSRLRNWGHIRQLSEARAARAVVSEVMDSITCDICRSMHGEEFRVEVADYKIGELSELSAEEYQRRVYDEAPEDWKHDPVKYAETHSAEQFIADNMVGPPFHPSCRGRVLPK